MGKLRVDSGSLESYISEKAFLELKLSVESSEEISCFRFGSSDTYNINCSNIRIKLCNNQSLGRIYEVTTSPCITGDFRSCPDPIVVKNVLPKHLNYADPDIFCYEQHLFDLLIGADIYHELVNIQKTRVLANGIVLIDTFFGWTPSVSLNSQSSKVVSTLVSGFEDNESIVTFGDNYDVCDLTDLTKFWSLETIGIKHKEMDDVHDRVVENFYKTSRVENGRFVVCWPWKSDKPDLSSNYRIARARLRKLLSSMNSDALISYNQIFMDYLHKGIIEDAPPESRFLIHYIPHRAEHQKGKIRIVFDASAKSSSGHSLNDMIYKGPSLQESIIKLILNFHLYPVALSADIEKAFLQVSLNDVDRDCVRFLWVKDWKTCRR